MPFTQTSKVTLLATLLVILLSSIASYQLLGYLNNHRFEKIQLQYKDQAQIYTNAIEQELTEAMSVAYAISAWVKQRQGDISHFAGYAEQIFPYYPYIAEIALAPKGTIKAIYPTTMAASRLGDNVFINNNPQRLISWAAQTNTVELAGPYQLEGGGNGIIGRLPIFIDTEGQHLLWGFVRVTLQIEKLSSLLPLTELPAKGIDYTLYLEKQGLQSTLVTLGSTQTPDKKAVVSNIFPDSTNWSLHLSPVAGWYDKQVYLYQVSVAVIFVLMLAALNFLLMKTLRRKQQLSELVSRKTKDLELQVARHRSFIAASNAASWEYDHASGLFQYSDEYFTMLGYTPSEHTLKHGGLEDFWLRLLHPNDVEGAKTSFYNYINGHDDSLYEHQFRMQHKDGHWVWILSRGRTITQNNHRLTVGIHIDVSQRKENEKKLQLLARIYEQSSEGLIITDANQRIVEVNNAFCTITGYSKAEVIGKDPKLLSSGRHDKTFYRTMWHSIESTGSWSDEIWNRRKDGSIYPEWLSISRIDGFEVEEVYYVGLFSDISKYKEDEAQIRFLAEFDSLTSLPNRVLIIDRTEQAIALSKQNQQSLAMLVIDLDRFKHINDSLGHQVGDEILVKLAKRLTALCRAEDTLSRFSSDEFVILRLNTNANAAAAFAEQLLPTILKPCLVAEQELVLSASIGIAMFPEDGDNFHDLYRHADIAMYQAKELGRNTYCFFTSAMQKYHARHLTIENALRRAIEQDELKLVFQPQYCFKQQKLIGFEVLLRWHQPQLGAISPAEFIPLAEKTGLIVSIGTWVLTEAIKQLATWHQQGYEDFTLAINLSPIQFRQPNLLLLIKKLLKTHAVPAAMVELEITESAMMDDPEQAAELIRNFNRFGLKVAIDDFGTGYSSLSYLKRFALSKLKIDQSFIRNILHDKDDKAIVSAIINIAKSMDLTTIAEGVESQEQQILLQQMGCEEIQGYFYSKPLSTTDAQAFLEAHGLCSQTTARIEV